VVLGIILEICYKRHPPILSLFITHKYFVTS